MPADQRRYLDHYRTTVQSLADGSAALSDAAKAELEAEMTRLLPDAPLTWMVGLGADAVAAELAGAMRSGGSPGLSGHG